MNRQLKTLIAICCLPIGLPAALQAGTVSWGIAGAGDDEFDLYSTGDPIFDPGFSYELGVFMEPGTSDEFQPDVQNIAVWEEHWVRVGNTTMFNPLTGAYGGNYDSNLFAGIPTGSRAYIWGYNSRTLADKPEWVLFTGKDAASGIDPSDTDWLSPNPDSVDDFAISWEPSTASVAMAGRISTTDPDEAGGEISGPGVLSENSIQSAKVPEPSIAGLIALIGCGALLRRKR